MLRKITIALATALVLAPLVAASGEEAAKAPAAPSAGFRAEILAGLDEVSGKVIELAGAVPQEKYAWRPAEGVRSVSEVYMHIAGGNYFMPTFLGVQPPAGMSREIEKEIDKTKVLDALKKSYEHARQVVLKTPDADLDKKIQLFGAREATVREALMLLVNHSHEHLGQSIAYARMNGVVPPWTAREAAGG